MSRDFKIGDFTIGANHKPFIIAEMSGNHNGDIERALKLVKAAADAGAHALKLQTYTADTITINHTGGLFDITDKNSLWYGKNLYELYQTAHTPWEWHKQIFDYAKELGMTAFSSPFDETAVDFLETLDVPAYKIASFESNHFPLLKKVAQTGKPILISSGTSNIDELQESVSYLKECGAKDIIIFKCTSTYPATAENTNVRTIPELQNIFEDCTIGLSDHTMGIGASIAAVALGARVIEKHFTIDKSLQGPDHKVSMDLPEMKSMILSIRKVESCLGDGIKQPADCEINNVMLLRRSLVFAKNFQKGHVLEDFDMTIKRPGNGLEPKFKNKIIGNVLSEDVIMDEPINWNHFL